MTTEPREASLTLPDLVERVARRIIREIARQDGFVMDGRDVARAAIAAIPSADTIVRQAGEIEKLRQALQPLADFADPKFIVPPELPITMGSIIAKRQLTMSDCYAARAALTRDEADG